MKFRFPLLALSLIGNALFIVGVLVQSHEKWGLQNISSTAPNTARPDLEGHTTVIQEQDRAYFHALASNTPLDWAEIRKTDTAAIVASFRKAGYPPSVLRAVAGELAAEKFAEKRRASRVRPPQYWENPQRVNELQASATAALGQIRRDELQMIRALLEPDAQVSGAISEQDRKLDYLSPEKKEKLGRILADYAELIAKMEAQAKGVTLPEDVAKRALLEREQRADLERLLTPDELFDYDLRTSPSADKIRRMVRKFDLTEAEFRALYLVQKTFDDSYPALGTPMSPEVTYARAAAHARLDSQFEDALGADRYAAFKAADESAWRGPDESALALERLVARLHLPSSTIEDVAAIRLEIHQRSAQVLSNQSLRPEQRTAQLTTLADEATARLTTVLSVAGFENYKQHGGEWINILKTLPVNPLSRNSR